MKRIYVVLLLSFTISSCAELQQIANQLPQGTQISQAEIGNGLRAALDKGIDQEVSKLMHLMVFSETRRLKSCYQKNSKR